MQAQPVRDPYPRNRLRTRSGDLLPPAALPEVPRAVLERLTGRRPAVPWIAPRAVKRLDRVLRPDWRLLELGAGRSTAWYAARVAVVVAVEPEPAWAAQVRTMLEDVPEARRPRIVEGPIAEFLAGEPDDYDAIVVDFSRERDLDRPEALVWARDRARRLVVLDDADRPSYGAADATMAGWRRESFIGFRSEPLRPIQTTLYLR